MKKHNAILATLVLSVGLTGCDIINDMMPEFTMPTFSLWDSDDSFTGPQANLPARSGGTAQVPQNLANCRFDDPDFLMQVRTTAESNPENPVAQLAYGKALESHGWSQPALQRYKALLDTPRDVWAEVPCRDIQLNGSVAGLAYESMLTLEQKMEHLGVITAPSSSQQVDLLAQAVPLKAYLEPTEPLPAMLPPQQGHQEVMRKLPSSSKKPKARPSNSHGGTTSSKARRGTTSTDIIHVPTKTVMGSGYKGWVVQLASYKGEKVASNNWKAAERKYGDMLLGYEPLVIQVDLGSKGTYYRLSVGGFFDKAEALGTCGDIKHAGGQCIVSRYP